MSFYLIQFLRKLFRFFDIQSVCLFFDFPHPVCHVLGIQSLPWTCLFSSSTWLFLCCWRKKKKILRVKVVRMGSLETRDLLSGLLWQNFVNEWSSFSSLFFQNSSAKETWRIGMESLFSWKRRETKRRKVLGDKELQVEGVWVSRRWKHEVSLGRVWDVLSSFLDLLSLFRSLLCSWCMSFINKNISLLFLSIWRNREQFLPPSFQSWLLLLKLLLGKYYCLVWWQVSSSSFLSVTEVSVVLVTTRHLQES